METDILIVGSGVAGLFCALHLPRQYRVLLLSKDALDRSDSYLAQGGICVLPEAADEDAFFEDTMRAGHYENNPDAVRTMIRSSRGVIDELIAAGVSFARRGEELLFTREGGHSRPRILFHEDITGREITSKLLARVRALPNVTLLPHTTMLDLIEEDGRCRGAVLRDASGALLTVSAQYTVLACGGIGGLFRHSTNYRHLTGDALAVCLRHGVPLEHPDYIQIHPTTLYSEKPGRRFLISESVRGEGAVLLGRDGERFVDELLPRDRLTAAIRAQMEKEGSQFVRLSLLPLGREKILSHFPHIYSRCLEEGYDVTREPIPVVPAQHYFMGGVKVDLDGCTSLPRLYAVGETSCTGVHGANRLASNSLLESLVFARRAALHLSEHYRADTAPLPPVDLSPYADARALAETNKKLILTEIERVQTR